MSRPFYPFAFIALVCWLLSSWAGAYGHFCFDGQEPLVSVHMEMVGDHDEHHPEEVHQDADIKLLQSVIAKLVSIDGALLLLAALALVFLVIPRTIFYARYCSLYYCVSLHWRPLLRAPPHSSSV
jgi:hypothetical protein